MCGGMCRDVLQRVSTFVVVAKNKYYCGLKKVFCQFGKKMYLCEKFRNEKFRNCKTLII